MLFADITSVTVDLTMWLTGWVSGGAQAPCKLYEVSGTTQWENVQVATDYVGGVITAGCLSLIFF